MSNLTKKFSRNSLKKATGHISAKVHSVEEEIARATNKRFNGDSWRKVSQSYRTLPNISPSETNSTIHSHSNSNTQILSALSSLTEDQAFHTGSSDIPVRSAASFTVTNCPPKGNDDETNIQKSLTSPPQNPNLKQTKPTRHFVDAPKPPKAPSIEKNNEKSERTCSTALLTTSQASESSKSSTKSKPHVPNVRNITRRYQKLTRPKTPERPPASATTTTTNNNNNQPPNSTPSEITTTTTERREQRPQQVSSGQKMLVTFVYMLCKLFEYFLILPDLIVRYLSTPPWYVRGRTVLITGASSGLGAEMARQLASQGAKLALVGETTEGVIRVAEECQGLGAVKASHYACDLANPVSTKLAMRQIITDYGKFDMVILIEGRSQGCYFEEIKDPLQIEQMIKLNINGAITCLHYILPHVPKSKDSRIVVISNTAGIVATPYQSIYSATKHALTGFSNALRIELKNTYGRESPKVCLVSLPELSGTKCNSDRMDMGARLPPAKWYSWAGLPLPHAVHELLPAIAAGKREFGQPARFNLWRALYSFCPDWVDLWMMKYIQRTHYRPLEESSRKGRSAQSKKPIERGPMNRSWAS